MPHDVAGLLRVSHILSFRLLFGLPAEALPPIAAFADFQQWCEQTGERAWSQKRFTQAGWIVALAKSKMLDDFGEEEAADTILKPYVLEGE